jgi:tape measure domain-containing protein
MASVGKASLTIVPKFDNLGKSVTTALKGVDSTSVGTAAGTSYSTGFTKGVSGILGAGAVMGVFSSLTSKAVDLVTSSVSSAVSRLDTLNNYPRVMQSLGYSAESASSSISTMSERLKGLPTALDDMASVVQGITAVTGDLDKSTQVGLALNDMLVASGANTALASSAMEQFRQILAKGKPEMEDWKSLTSAMPGQMAQLAKSMLGAEATANDLYAALGGGKNDQIITLDELMDAIVKLDQEGGEGITSFAEQAKTASGGIDTAMTNMKTAVSRGIAAIFDDIGSDTIATFFSSLGSGFENGLKYVGDVIADVKTPLMEAAAPVVQEVGDFIGSAAVQAKEPLEDVIKALPQIVSAAAPAAAGLIGLTAANAGLETLAGVLTWSVGPLGKMSSAAKKASETFFTFATKLKEGSKASELMLGVSEKLAGTMGGPIVAAAGLAAAAIGLIAAAVINAKQKADTYSDATDGLVEVSKSAGTAIKGVSDAFAGIGEAPTSTAKNLSEISEAIDELVEKQQSLSTTIAERTETASTDIGTLQAYRGVIDQYANSVDLNETEQEKLKFAIDRVNEACGTQYSVVDASQGKIADETGEILNNTKAIDENIEARQKQIKYDMLSESLKDLYSQQIEDSKNLTDALTAQKEAQDAYDDAVDRVGRGDSTAVQAMYTYKAVLQKASDEVERVQGLYDATSDSIDSMVKAMYSVADGSDIVQAALLGMGSGVTGAIVNAGGDIESFSQACVDAGVSAADLMAVGTDSFAKMAESCGGDLSALIAAVKIYNATPIIDKEGNVNVEDASLVDANGEVYTWNSDINTLTDKYGRALVDETQLTDALGNVFDWNGSSLVDQWGVAYIDDGVPASKQHLDEWNSDTLQNKDATAEVKGNLEYANGLKKEWNAGGLASWVGEGIVNIVKNISEVFTGSQNAAGGIRLNADGGVRLHASGAIAKSAVPLDIVGEDGAEAIVPLTNKKYSQPFIDLLVDGITSKSSDESGVIAAVAELKDAISNMSIYLDGTKMVGYMAKGMNSRLGKLQRMGAVS